MARRRRLIAARAISEYLLRMMQEQITAFDAQAAADALRSWMTQFESVVVAYSGGVDSALVMAAAHAALGERAIACIGVSPSYPKRVLDRAIEVAEGVGARYQLIHTEEHLDPRY